MQESLRWEVRTYASHCEHSLHSQSICILDRHLHVIIRTKNTKIYTWWTGSQLVKPFILVTWPTVAGSQTRRIPYTKQSRASWERWLGRIPYYCCLRISRPQQDPTLLLKIRLFTEEEFFSEPRPGLISSPKSKLGIKFKAFGWTELQKNKP